MLTTRALTAIALTTLLTFHAGVAPLAMEKTATKEVDQQSTDLNTDMKISAFSAAIQAAVNSLIAKVNAFDGRITTVETWRPIIQADVDSLKARVTALEKHCGVSLQYVASVGGRPDCFPHQSVRHVEYPCDHP